jgi:hypothetical protein
VADRVRDAEVPLAPVVASQEIQADWNRGDAGRLLQQAGERDRHAREHEIEPRLRPRAVERNRQRDDDREVHQQLAVEREAPIIAPGTEQRVRNAAQEARLGIEQTRGDEVRARAWSRRSTRPP